MVPASHQYPLTVLSIWEAFDWLLASLIAWPLIGGYSCITPRAYHTLPENIQQGMAMLLLWVIGFELLNLYESPKYLMGRRKNAAAVEIVHKVTL